MKIGVRAPNKPPVVVSLLLAIIALIAYFVSTPARVLDCDVRIHRWSSRRPGGNLKREAGLDSCRVGRATTEALSHDSDPQRLRGLPS